MAERRLFRFLRKYGPVSLFTKITYQMKDIEGLKFDADRLNRQFQLQENKHIPNAVWERIRHFNIQGWTLVMIEIHEGKNKPTNTTWEYIYDRTRYWIVVTRKNYISTIYIPSSHDKLSIIKSGNVYKEIESSSRLYLSSIPKTDRQSILNIPTQEMARYKDIDKSTSTKEENKTETDLFYQIPVLSSNGTRCPYCKRDFSGMVNIRYHVEINGNNDLRFTTARKCQPCNLIILDESQYQQIKHQINQIRRGKIFTLNPSIYKTSKEIMDAAKTLPDAHDCKICSDGLPFEEDPKQSVNLSEHDKKITIFSQKCHCSSCFKKYGMHTIVSRTAKVFTTSGKLVNVNVMFCAGCGHYYMSYESFKQYKKLYGRLLFECELSGELQNSQASFINFAPDSLLSRWGYNVKKDTSKEQRQAILQFLLETKRISKFDAIEMIKGFILLKEVVLSLRGSFIEGNKLLRE